ncbi:hypothetical protein FC42_GL000398 [Lactobacillus iners DSM 13335]|uniref:Uncharacterized protein n=1 Tax=Lactobacillus iners DSM 13335 TaxID=525328 RepID=C8PC49_9LACO|nr:hypothetical protein [Lactobacillus iners]EEW52348.1 hypothetical protein HMPREF0520_0669 [Lactobacillus iners DSM 13335]KRL59324.1 hypothetical protein FC42_GL000398 [Lactobacillus iners DSM 13335]
MVKNKKDNGPIDLSKIVSNVDKDVTQAGKLYYGDVAFGVVEASDLFEGAYNDEG